MATYPDDFNRADGVLTTPWATVDGAGLEIVSNELRSAGGGQNISALTGETFDDDQQATVEVTVVQGYDFAGAAVRMVDGGNGYVGLAEFGDGRFFCYRIDAGVWTSLGFRSETFVATDTIGIGIVGSTITLYKNDVAVGATFSDSTYTSGAPGVAYNFGDSNITRLDNFSATGWDSGTSATDTINFIAPAGYDLVTLTSVAPVGNETDWIDNLDTPAAIGDQSLENSAEVVHNVDGTSTFSQAVAYTYYTIDATDGVMSSITKALEQDLTSTDAQIGIQGTSGLVSVSNSLLGTDAEIAIQGSSGNINVTVILTTQDNQIGIQGDSGTIVFPVDLLSINTEIGIQGFSPNNDLVYVPLENLRVSELTVDINFDEE